MTAVQPYLYGSHYHTVSNQTHLSNSHTGYGRIPYSSRTNTGENGHQWLYCSHDQNKKDLRPSWIHPRALAWPNTCLPHAFQDLFFLILFSLSLTSCPPLSSFSPHNYHGPHHRYPICARLHCGQYILVITSGDPPIHASHRFSPIGPWPRLGLQMPTTIHHCLRLCSLCVVDRRV